MKIPASVRALYDDQKSTNDRLRKTVDERMFGIKKERWHYESRVKELPSFALKVESGRFKDPRALEDFFACTLVVGNAREIDEVEKLIQENFVVERRKPEQDNRTHKAANEFPFDDLRLYVTLQKGPAIPPSDLSGVVFEVQIKTFLQHAWSIATHDLVYKTDDVNWSKERIAFQIKAMLEHAEISIQEAERLATSSVLAKEDADTKDLKNAIALIKAQWWADELPEDVRRLSVNIVAVLKALSIRLDRLQEVLDAGKAQHGGAHPKNLSPYCTVIQYLFDAEKGKMLSYLSRDNARTRILIPEEIELPADIDTSKLRNAVFIAASQ
jgi:ppGpp synthetase/RelA/SpoT-type nucleotidyltranferase